MTTLDIVWLALIGLLAHYIVRRPRRRDRGIPYAQKLLDRRWIRLSRRIKRRDGWRCVICGSLWMLETHHCRKAYHDHRQYYEPGKEPWEARPEHLETLCGNCHSNWSEKSRKTFPDRFYYSRN